MSGYFEWQTIAPKVKQPWYFTRRDLQPVTTAGLWDEWKDVETGNLLRSCTMIITEPNRFMSEVHDRMPVVLEPDQFEPWLSGKAGVEMMKPAAEDVLTTWPVSPRVNSSRAHGDDPTLIEPIATPVI
jgi:putative SOS response-associated peptidase YedK